MPIPLLQTKLYIPAPRPDAVHRSRLIEQVNGGLHNGHKLTLVSAPAGFGKTTLITEWISDGSRPVAWLSMDEGDNDPIQFLQYLIASLQRVHADIGDTVLQVLQSPQMPSMQNLITSLINDIAASATALTLVLDDYHLVTSPAVHEITQFLVTYQPSMMHLVIGTREDPPLTMAQLRARGQITEIRERDLRFARHEIEAFFEQTMRLPLKREAVDALDSRTEGWIAGLQLAALAMQADGQHTDAFIAAFMGDDRFIMDYLIVEVLERQPESIRDFLRQTAILDRLSAPLCNATTERDDTQAVLEQLDAANLFLIPLDHRREWYRYHRLFAEVLRAGLSPEEQLPLHERAMGWHEANGSTDQAIHHALAYASLSGDSHHAERLILAAGEENILRGRILTVKAWLNALSEGRVRSHPTLAAYMGWVLAMTGEMDLAEDFANAAGSAEADALQAGVTAPLLLLRAWIAMGRHDYEAVTGAAQQALKVLKEDQFQWRIIGLWAIAESQERTGHVADAITAFREAALQGRMLNNQVFAAVVEMSLAAALNNHGERHQAVAVCEEAIQRHLNQYGRALPITGVLFNRLAMLLYEANELDEAYRCTQQGFALSEEPAMGSQTLFLYGISAPILYASGKMEEAQEALQRAHGSISQQALTEESWILAVGANIALKQGDVAAASRWMDAANVSLDEKPDYLRLDAQITYGRLLLAQGMIEEAHQWLTGLERFANEHGLIRSLISIYLLQTLVAEKRGDVVLARERVADALRLAAPQDYYRAFLDEDARIIGLLPPLRSIAPAFVRQLLEYAGLPQSQEKVLSPTLVEPLSEREIEVLGLIAAGLANREIADRLVIAVGTVKRHINNIYGKLDVRNRTQAVAKGRELGIL